MLIIICTLSVTSLLLTNNNSKVIIYGLDFILTNTFENTNVKSSLYHALNFKATYYSGKLAIPLLYASSRFVCISFPAYYGSTYCIKIMSTVYIADNHVYDLMSVQE